MANAERPEEKTRRVMLSPLDERNELSPDDLKDIVEIKAPSYYTNNTRISISRWDARFIFSEILPTSKTDIGLVQERATVVMSHQQVKALLDVLLGLIRTRAADFNLESIYGQYAEAGTGVDQNESSTPK